MGKVDTTRVASYMLERYSVPEVEPVPHADLHPDASWYSGLPTSDSSCDVQAVRVHIWGQKWSHTAPAEQPRPNGVHSLRRDGRAPGVRPDKYNGIFFSPYM